MKRNLSPVAQYVRGVKQHVVGWSTADWAKWYERCAILRGDNRIKPVHHTRAEVAALRKQARQS